MTFECVNCCGKVETMIAFGWDSADETIMRITVADPWTWDEYFAQVDVFNRLLDTLPYTVDVIADYSDVQRLPLNALSFFRRAVAMMHPRMGMMAVVSHNEILHTLGMVLVRLIPQLGEHSRPARTEAEAYRIIARARAGRL